MDVLCEFVVVKYMDWWINKLTYVQTSQTIFQTIKLFINQGSLWIHIGINVVYCVISLSFHCDITEVSLTWLLFHNDISEVSLSIHCDFGVVSLWFQHDITVVSLISLWYLCGSITYHCGIVEVLLWHNCGLLRYHCGITVVCLGNYTVVHWGTTVVSLWCNYGIMWYHCSITEVSL